MPCVKSGARAGSLYRNLVAHALTLGASGDRAPVRQQPCNGIESAQCLNELHCGAVSSYFKMHCSGVQAIKNNSIMLGCLISSNFRS